jgi:putative two-component system response regulator
LAGEEIPLLARLLSVANVYDHLTAGAEGAPAFAPEDALGELRRQAGTRFDPAMVEVLAAVIKRLPVRSLS